MPVIGTDQVTIVDLTDGYTVTMAPESYAFPATATAAKAGSVPVLISALVGTETVAASVTLSEVTAPTGVTVTKDTNATTPTLTITVATSVTAPGIVTIPVHIGDVIIVKKFAFSLAYTGAGGSAGVSATNVIVGLTDITIPTDATGKTVAGSTITIPFAGYVGATRVAATVAASGLPTGITVGTNTAATTSADGSLVLNVANASTLGGTSSGLITLTFTANSQTHVKYFTWAKALAGTDGAAGKDAIVLAVTSSNGTIFKNTAIATTLTARIYKGGIEQTQTQIDALGTVSWYKDGGATPVGTGLTLVLDAGQVTSRAVYEARLEG